MVPDGEWRQKGGRRVLIYLGADAGAELDYIINMDRDQHQKCATGRGLVSRRRALFNRIWQPACARYGTAAPPPSFRQLSSSQLLSQGPQHNIMIQKNFTLKLLNCDTRAVQGI